MSKTSMELPKKTVLLVVIIVILGLVFLFRDSFLRMFFIPTSSPIETGVTMDQVETKVSDKVNDEVSGKPDIEVVIENLNIPWELVFLPARAGEPDGRMLITERPGDLLIIGKDKKTIKVQGVYHFGEGGLLGMALHPDFQNNNFVYLYFTSSVSGKVSNRVERYKLIGDTLVDKRTILEEIPGAANHDGGRLKFGPDGFLYVTTGDSQNSDLSQDTASLAGKILRVKDDGSIPADNPFGNAIYSYGHRNVQGIAWDSGGRLWATEHGRSGVQSGLDEINLIVKGANYGWPVIQGDQTSVGMFTPVINSGVSDTWAPSGMVFYEGRLFWAGLRGESLYEATIAEDKLVNLKANFRGEYGRFRTVVVGPDGYFYVLTNNRDGRGTPKSGDDKIIRINPQMF